MPIALLPELTKTLDHSGDILTPWGRLVLLEQQILRRARGAFLVHWFGTSVPVRGLSLYIAIANIDEFKRRYLQVQRSMPGPDTELNLLGPLSGMAGLLVGMAVSPSGALIIATQSHRLIDSTVGGVGGGLLGMLYRLIGVWLLPALGPALGVLAIPLLLFGAVGAAVGGEGTARSLYRILGEAAMLIDAVARFWEQVTGPRGEVRNPLLRSILNLLDRVAGLFVQVVGFAALLLVRIAPLIPNLVDQFRAMMDLLEVVWEALADLFTDFGQRLAAPFLQRPGVETVLNRVFDAIVDLPGLVIDEVTALVEGATSDLTTAFGAISSAIETFIDSLSGKIVAAFTGTAVGVLLERLERIFDLMPVVRAAFANAPSPEEEEEAEGAGFFKRWGLWIATGGLLYGSLGNLLDSLENLSVPDFPDLDLPDFPDTPTLPDLDQLMDRIGRPSGLDTATMSETLRAEAEAALAERSDPEGILRDPVSAFAMERRELERSMGRPELQLDDERVRDLIYIAVGRVLPPALRVHAPAVREMFDWLDENVYRVEREPLEQPMLELEDSGRLRPIVEVLTIRSSGGFAPDLRAFRDLVMQELQGKTYLAVAAE